MDHIYNPQLNEFDTTYNDTNIKDDMYYIHNQYNNQQIFQDTNPNQVVLRKQSSIVPLNSKYRDRNRFPNANNIIYDLPRNYSNVAKIELVGSIFPNVDHVIKGESAGSLQNNVLRWTNVTDRNLVVYTDIDFVHSFGTYFGFLYNYRVDKAEKTFYLNHLNRSFTINTSPSLALDGTPSTLLSFDWEDVGNFTTNVTTDIVEYSIPIKPGNYSFNTLMDAVGEQMNQVRKIDNEFHFFVFTYNEDTDIISASPYIVFVLPDNPITTVSGSYDVFINSPGHFFVTGDTIRLIGISGVGGIPESILNNEFVVTFIDADTLRVTVSIKAGSSNTGGGNNCRIGELTSFKFLFGDIDRYGNRNKGFISRNMGFRPENSGEVLDPDPLRPISYSITSTQNLGSNVFRLFLTDGILAPNEFLKPCRRLDITDITAGVITVSEFHNIPEKSLVYLYIPSLSISSYMQVIPISNTKLKTSTLLETTDLSDSFLKFGDTIQINGVNISPTHLNKISSLEKDRYNYFVENCGIDFVDVYIPRAESISLVSTLVSNSDSKYSAPKVFTEFLRVEHFSNLFNGIDYMLDSTSIVTEVSGEPYFTCKFIDDVSYIGSASGLNTSVLDVTSGTFTVDVVFEPAVTPDISSFVFVEANGTGLTAPWVTANRVSGNTYTGSIDLPDGTYPIGSTYIITGDANLRKSLQNCRVKDGTNPSVITDNTIDFVHSYNGIYNIMSNTNDPKTLKFFTYLSRGGSLYGGDTIGGEGTFDTVRNEVQIYNVLSNNGTDKLLNVELDSINSKHHEIRLLSSTNNFYTLKVLRRYFRDFDGKDLGGDRVFISSDIHGYGQNRSNTEFWFKTGELYSAVDLRGEDYVFLMTKPITNTINSLISYDEDIFAQLILDKYPGNMCFNSFISEPQDFSDSLLSSLNKISIKLLYENRQPYDLKNLEYSITLKITEYIKTIKSLNTQNSFTNEEVYELSNRRQ